MYLKIAAEIALAVLAVFGLYALLRLLVTARFCALEVHWVLYVMRDMTAAQLDELLQAAREERFFYPNAPLLLLVQRGICEETLRFLKEQGIPFYIVEHS